VTGLRGHFSFLGRIPGGEANPSSTTIRSHGSLAGISRSGCQLCHHAEKATKLHRQRCGCVPLKFDLGTLKAQFHVIFTCHKLLFFWSPSPPHFIMSNWAPVAPACNPSYSGGEIRRIRAQSQPGQIVLETLSWKTLDKNRTGGVAQGEGPEFKPQYH
jgi:hypothetical protein